MGDRNWATLDLERTSRTNVRPNGEELLAWADGGATEASSNAECAMKRSLLISLIGTLCTAALIVGPARPATQRVDIDLTKWAPPDIATVADDPFGRLV